MLEGFCKKERMNCDSYQYIWDIDTSPTQIN